MCRFHLILFAAFLALLQTSGKEPAPAKDPQPRTDRHGDPLPAEALSRLGTVRFRHGLEVKFVRFTPDGKVLISQGWDGARTWSAATGKLIHAFPSDLTADVFAGPPSLTRDCKKMATASLAGVDLWDVVTAKPLCKCCTDSYRVVCLSPDGELLAAVPTLGPEQVEMIATQSSRHLWARNIGERRLACMAFTPDGNSLVVAGCGSFETSPVSDNAIHFLDVKTGKEVGKIDLGNCEPSKIELSSDGCLLAVICRTNTIAAQVRVWQLASTKQLIQLEAPTRLQPDVPGYFSALAFGADGKTLLSAGNDDWLTAWDLATGKALRRIARRMADSSGLSIAPNGKTVAVATSRSLIRIIDLTTGEDVVPVTDYPASIHSVTVTPDSQLVGAAGADSRWVLWNRCTGVAHNYFHASSDNLSVRFLPDGCTAWAMDSHSKTFHMWDLATAKERSRFIIDFAGDPPLIKGLTPNGQVLAVIAISDDTLHLVGLPQGRRLAAIKDEDFKTLAFVLFTADSKTMITMSWEYMVQFWDLASGKELHRFGPIGDSVESNDDTSWRGPGSYSATVSPNGELLAYGSQQGYICLYDTATGRKIRKLDKLPSAPMELAFSPDGRTLAWAGVDDPMIHVIELVSGKERHVFAGHRGGVLSLAFSPDCKTLVSGSKDTTALVWDLVGQLRNVSDAPLSNADLESSWAALSDDDAARAYEAMRTFGSAHRTAVPFLGERLRPVSLPDEKLLARLFADLDSAEFGSRETATKLLFDLGDAMEARCRKVLKRHPSAEVRRRLEAFLEHQARDRSYPSRERLRTLRALEVLELAGTPEAERVLESLAGGVPEAMVTEKAKTSLERLLQRHAAAAKGNETAR